MTTPEAFVRFARRLSLALLLPALLGGCGVMQGAKLLAPESFGLAQAAPGIYVEAGADETARAQLRNAARKAEAAVRAAYGGMVSHPTVHACFSEACYESFGGKGSRAKVYGDRILLSPRGMNWHYLAHEWSHAELWSRLTFSAWLRLPTWFDEGVAVAVSEAPENAESHWQYLVSANIARPTPDELRTFRSISLWDSAVGRYGEKANAERRARGEPEIRPVYTAAGQELRPWLAKAGSAGLRRLIEGLNAGEEFEELYRMENR